MPVREVQGVMCVCVCTYTFLSTMALSVFLSRYSSDTYPDLH